MDAGKYEGRSLRQNETGVRVESNAGAIAEGDLKNEAQYG